jgi:alpha-tubulin suppressor-like RCC1 family protein
MHTCVLLEDQSVKCWGRNQVGQLGVGDTSNHGDALNEMADNLPTVNLGAGKTALAIAAGGDATCVLLDGGHIKCWGSNQYGQLGQGDKENRGDEANEMGDDLPPVNMGTGKTAIEVRTDQAHTCALLSDGTVRCWGQNTYGQVGA